MFQISRMYKSSSPTNYDCIRSHGNLRKQRTYYEILGVQSNASQKEIKNAFLQLSKEIHPDTSGRNSHAEFVEINQAYLVLGKRYSRNQYDLSLKYNTSTNDQSYRNYYPPKEDLHSAWRRQYGFPQRSMHHRKPPQSWIIWGFTVAVIASCMHIYITHFYIFRRATYFRGSYNNGFNQIKQHAPDKTWEEQVDSFKSTNEKADDTSTR